jgi:hypothetical protein
VSSSEGIENKTAAWAPGISKLIDARALERLDWLQRHYPDGPDCVGSMNQTLNALEQLVRSTVSASLARVQTSVARKQLTKLHWRAACSFGAVIVAFLVSGGPFSADIQATGAVLTVVAIAASAYFLFKASEEKREILNDLSVQRNFSALAESRREVSAYKAELSEECVKALDHAPKLHERVDRSGFDDVLTYVNEELDSNSLIHPQRNNSDNVFTSNWLNGLLVLDDVYSSLINDPLQVTASERRDNIRRVFRRALRNSSDEIVLGISEDLNDELLSLTSK